MAEDVRSRILSFNPTNWLTVVLMVAIMYFLVGAIIKALKSRKAGAGAAE